jgi:protein SCO1
MNKPLPWIVPFLLVGGGLLFGCDRGASHSVAASSAGTLDPSQASDPLLAYGDEVFVHRSELLVPKQAPPFALIDQEGELVKSEDLDGKVALVGFVYTTCPDICRAIVASYLDLQDVFAEELEGDDLELVLITTDPERDTPEQTQKYTKGFGGKWTFLTGSAEELNEVWSAFHVTVEQRVGAPKSKHTWMVVLIDRHSKIRIRYMGQDVPKDVLAADVRSLLEEKP